MGVGSFAWGAAADRFGTRVVVYTGLYLASLGLGLAAALLAFAFPPVRVSSPQRAASAAPA